MLDDVIPIQKERLFADIRKLAEFGSNGSGLGISRSAFSPAYKAAADWLMAQMSHAGMHVRMDEAGNIIGRLGPSGGPAVVCGSHMDSVPGGGALDGTLGVLAGLEVARCLSEKNSTLNKAFELIAFADEEGAYSSLFGVRSMVGTMTLEEVMASTGPEDETLFDAMQRFGLDPARIPDAARPRDAFDSYVELHIEQGPVLENQGADIGIVDSIVGIQNMEFVFEGQANHAGTTPVDLRHDALRAAAEAMAECFGVLEREFADDVRLTYGKLDVLPGASNVVPARVKMNQEIRAKSEAEIEKLSQQTQEIASAIGGKYGVSVQSNLVSTDTPAQMSPQIMSLISEVCEAATCTSMVMVSGAGHDAQVMARVCRAGLIFVPSTEGLSHNPNEYTPDRNVLIGTQILYRTLNRLLEGPQQG